MGNRRQTTFTDNSHFLQDISCDNLVIPSLSYNNRRLNDAIATISPLSPWLNKSETFYWINIYLIKLYFRSNSKSLLSMKRVNLLRILTSLDAIRKQEERPLTIHC